MVMALVELRRRRDITSRLIGQLWHDGMLSDDHIAELAKLNRALFYMAGMAVGLGADGYSLSWASPFQLCGGLEAIQAAFQRYRDAVGAKLQAGVS